MSPLRTPLTEARSTAEGSGNGRETPLEGIRRSGNGRETPLEGIRRSGNYGNLFTTGPAEFIRYIYK